MSASLVGSEMCIRDRAPFEPSKPPAALCATRRWRRLLLGGGSLLRSPACLLYTSDAADDM
eukprot:9976699-Alexandrium_andersonii.AAC.1